MLGVRPVLALGGCSARAAGAVLAMLPRYHTAFLCDSLLVAVSGSVRAETDGECFSCDAVVIQLLYAKWSSGS